MFSATCAICIKTAGGVGGRRVFNLSCLSPRMVGNLQRCKDRAGVVGGVKWSNRKTDEAIDLCLLFVCVWLYICVCVW